MARKKPRRVKPVAGTTAGKYGKRASAPGRMKAAGSNASSLGKAKRGTTPTTPTTASTPTANATNRSAGAPGRAFKAAGLSNASTLAKARGGGAPENAPAPNTPEEVHASYGNDVSAWAKTPRPRASKPARTTA